MSDEDSSPEAVSTAQDEWGALFAGNLNPREGEKRGLNLFVLLILDMAEKAEEPAGALQTIIGAREEGQKVGSADLSDHDKIGRAHV